MSSTTNTHFAAPPGEAEKNPAEEARKRFATLQARAAMAGVALSRLDDDRGRPVFIASKWALTKQLDSLDEVSAFLTRIGGDHGQ